MNESHWLILSLRDRSRRRSFAITADLVHRLDSSTLLRHCWERRDIKGFESKALRSLRRIGHPIHAVNTRLTEEFLFGKVEGVYAKIFGRPRSLDRISFAVRI